MDWRRIIPTIQFTIQDNLNTDLIYWQLSRHYFVPRKMCIGFIMLHIVSNACAQMMNFIRSTDTLPLSTHIQSFNPFYTIKEQDSGSLFLTLISFFSYHALTSFRNLLKKNISYNKTHNTRLCLSCTWLRRNIVLYKAIFVEKDVLTNDVCPIYDAIIISIWWTNVVHDVMVRTAVMWNSFLGRRSLFLLRFLRRYTQ